MKIRAIALCAVLALPAFGQFPKILGKKDDKEKEAKNTLKNEERYEKLKQYSFDKYKSDSDFRDDVDEAYENLMRAHSDRAYLKNTSISSKVVTVREDRWRVHENLYDNLLVQDHINAIGQKLVAPESERLFAFKVIPEPTPVAETLATGTIYISTGLISLLDSEAQLAYVLAHEAGHVQLEHWKERVMLDRGQRLYAEEQQKKAASYLLIGGLLGAGLGGAIGQSGGAAFAGATAGVAAGAVANALINRPLVVDWDRTQEDAADEYALKAVMAARYDVREVPNLYVSMQKIATRDARVGLGFLGSRKRIDQRLEKSRDLLANAYKADVEAKLKDGGFLSTSAEHRNLMAELKRDNGIMAYYHDMFDMARANLMEATAIRDNDPAAHYYYAKVLKLVGHTPEEEKTARDEFAKAAKADIRDDNYGSHLHLALMMAHEKDPDKKAISQELDSYVTDFAKYNVTARMLELFPPNLETIYEYMSLYGDPGWTPKPPDVHELATTYSAINAVAPPTPVTATASVPAATPAATPAVTVPALPATVQNVKKAVGAAGQIKK